MITNERLYSLDEKKIDAGDNRKYEVVKKSFEVRMITHLIFIAENLDD